MADQAPDNPRPANATPPEQQGMPLGHDVSSDPVDGYEPVPLWLLSIFGLFLAWGGWYLGTYNGGWRWFELDEYSGTGGVAASQPAEDPIALGKRIFAGNCVSCHQGNGQGLPGQYPTLNGSEWVAGNPAWMKRIVLHGLEGPIEVAGQRYNNVMPGLGMKLNDKQVAAVITFVRTNAEWGNNAGAVTPEQVAATRDATKGRTTPWSPSELKTIVTDEGPAQAPASGPSSATATGSSAKPATRSSTAPASAPATSDGPETLPAAQAAPPT